jgi:hypothetical protein
MPAGTVIDSKWNLDAANNIINFGGSIAAGGNWANSGLILKGPGAFGVAVLNSACVGCVVQIG